MSLLCLHLLQASMVYINTLMIQQVLEEPGWSKRMTPRDLAALSPLITQHINPYGHGRAPTTCCLNAETHANAVKPF